jgi:hypothetical protein
LRCNGLKFFFLITQWVEVEAKGDISVFLFSSAFSIHTEMKSPLCSAYISLRSLAVQFLCVPAAVGDRAGRGSSSSDLYAPANSLKQTQNSISDAVAEDDRCFALAAIYMRS